MPGFVISVLEKKRDEIWEFDNYVMRDDQEIIWKFCFDQNNSTDIYMQYINRGYYTVARRYEFYFRVAKQYFTNERIYHSKIKFITSSRHVMFFVLCRQNDIDKIIEGNYRNYVIDKFTCEIIMENKPFGSRMQFL